MPQTVRRCRWYRVHLNTSPTAGAIYPPNNGPIKRKSKGTEKNQLRKNLDLSSRLLRQHIPSAPRGANHEHQKRRIIPHIQCGYRNHRRWRRPQKIVHESIIGFKQCRKTGGYEHVDHQANQGIPWEKENALRNPQKFGDSAPPTNNATGANWKAQNR